MTTSNSFLYHYIPSWKNICMWGQWK